ncbi:MAG: cytochrome P460 family protein [Bryobacteraceae bacterium]
MAREADGLVFPAELAVLPDKVDRDQQCYLKINTASELRYLRVRPAQGRCKVVTASATFAHAEGEKETYRNASGIAITLSFAAIGAYWRAGAQTNTCGTDGLQFVDNTGNIRKPTNVRGTYQSLCAFAVLDPKGNQMHFTTRLPAQRKRIAPPKVPDRTVLVKEVFGTEHAQMTTADANWASGTNVWFLLTKDAKGRYPGNSVWGDGWGWALFKVDSPDKQVATNYKIDCLGCHIPAKSTDWIYIQGIRFSDQNEERYRRKAGAPAPH